MSDQLFSASELEELKQDFIVETYEHLENAQDGLLQLENEPHNYELLNFIFREIHSIKGGANFLGFEDIINVSHEMESVLDKMRSYEIYPSSDVINAIIEGIGIIKKLTSDIENNRQSKVDYSYYLQQLQKLSNSVKPSKDQEKGNLEVEINIELKRDSQATKSIGKEIKQNELENFQSGGKNDDSEDSHLTIISFEYSNVTYGIEVEFVREIVRLTDITPIPFSKNHIMGLMNLRGDVVTIVDFGKLLGVKESETAHHRVLIINYHEITFGLYVDNVKEVVTVLPQELKPFEIESITSSEILKDIIAKNNEFIQVINIEKLIEKSRS